MSSGHHSSLTSSVVMASASVPSPVCLPRLPQTLLVCAVLTYFILRMGKQEETGDAQSSQGSAYLNVSFKYFPDSTKIMYSSQCSMSRKGISRLKVLSAFLAVRNRWRRRTLGTKHWPYLKSALHGGTKFTRQPKNNHSLVVCCALKTFLQKSFLSFLR